MEYIIEEVAKSWLNVTEEDLFDFLNDWFYFFKAKEVPSDDIGGYRDDSNYEKLRERR